MILTSYHRVRQFLRAARLMRWAAAATVMTATAGIVQETGTGTITSGEFTGDTAVFTWIYALVNPLLCLAPGGMTGQNGTLIIEVTGV